MEISTEQKVENAIKWIRGLSNTKLPQGDGELGDRESGFCCLGYGCYRLGLGYDPRDEYSEILVEEVGLNNEYGDIYNDGIYIDETYTAYTLVDLNDDYGYSFKRISTVLKNRAGDIFEPKVAEGIKKYFNKK